jgi:hypothetical protein
VPVLHAEDGEPVGIRAIRWLSLGKGRWVFIPFGLVLFGWLGASYLIDHSWGLAAGALAFFVIGVYVAILSLKNRGLRSPH